MSQGNNFYRFNKTNLYYTMKSKWSPTGKARGTLANAHVGRHSPTNPGQAGHTMAHSSSRFVPGGLLLPE